MRFDIVIIGAGPSGCSCAIMLKQYGYNVAIFDRDSFPKHNIGESLLPIINSDYMKVIGVDEKIKTMGFPKKYGTTFIWGNNREPWSLFFDKRLESDQQEYSQEQRNNILNGDYKHSYQVNRYHFDKIFVDRAKEVGVEVFENSSVSEIELRDDKKEIGLITLANGEVVEADFFVDASGQIAKVANTLGQRKFNTDLGFSATYTYFQGAKFQDNFLTKNTQYVVSIDIGWIWFIHIGNDITSVGLVSDKKNVSHQEFISILNNIPELSGLIENANIVDSLGNKSDKIYKARNRSYFNESLHGNNYVCVGDAAGFVDPILSGGLSLALMSGITSSAYIDNFLKNKDISILQKYEKIVFDDIENYYQLAKYWYSHNKSTQSWFWQAKSILGLEISNTYNKRAFTFLASGGYYTNKNFEEFNELRIGNFAYNFEDVDEINHLFDASAEQVDFSGLFRNLQQLGNQEEYQNIVKKLWLQIKIIEKQLKNMNSNFGDYFSYIVQNFSKMKLFQFVFKGNNFQIIYNHLQDTNYDIDILQQEIIFETIFQIISDQKFFEGNIIYNKQIKNIYILQSKVELTILESDVIKSIWIKNNDIFINGNKIERSSIQYSLDKYIA